MILISQFTIWSFVFEYNLRLDGSGGLEFHGLPVAGTTQNQSDGWFIGMVPNLSTGVWVGAEDRSVHFADLTRGQGASMALPIWALYMKRNYSDEDLGISQEEFERPEDLNINVDCDKIVDEEEDADLKKKLDPNEEIEF